MSEVWYYTRQGQQTGPVTEDQLRQLLSSGQLSLGELVWREGLPGWMPPQAVPGLLTPAVFAAALPPAQAPPAAAPTPLATGVAAMVPPNMGLLPGMIPTALPAPTDNEGASRRKRKRRSKGSSTALKALYVGGATVAGLALLGVVVLFVIVPLFDPALVETFAGTYPVDLEGHQKTTHEAFFKKGQEVIIKVTNHGGMEHFQVTVRDPDEKTVISRTNTLHDNAEIRFVTKQAGRYQIEISNDSGFYGRAVVKYRAN